VISAPKGPQDCARGFNRWACCCDPSPRVEGNRIPRSITASIVPYTALCLQLRGLAAAPLERDPTTKRATSNGMVRLLGRRRRGTTKTLLLLLGRRHARHSNPECNAPPLEPLVQFRIR
jgi:hypothetical protein